MLLSVLSKVHTMSIFETINHGYKQFQVGLGQTIIDARPALDLEYENDELMEMGVQSEAYYDPMAVGDKPAKIAITGLATVAIIGISKAKNVL